MRCRRRARSAAWRRCASAAAKRSPWWSSDKMQVAKIGVIGAGQMGGGIAQVAAQSGIDVVLVDAQRDWAEKGRKKIDAALDKLVQRGKLDGAARASAMERIRIADNYAGFADCDLVVEAATENQE